MSRARRRTPTLHRGSTFARYIDATVGCLHQAGFSYEMADHAWNAIDART